MQEGQTQNTTISDDEVAQYLHRYPHFFEQHASLLAEMFLPSPHGRGAISLAERQQLAQRDKIRVLEVKLASLIAFAKENDVTSEKVHRLSLNLLKNTGFENLQTLIAQSLQQDFAVTQSAMRIWTNPIDNTLLKNVAFTPVNSTFSDWVIALAAPYCGAKPELADDLLSDSLQSFAFIPLYKEADNKHAFGVLLLGAEDPQRFKENMGLMYLERIGDLVSASLAAYI